MDHVEEFFSKPSDESPRGNFHQVIALHEDKTITWEDVLSLDPKIPRGWFELSHLSTKDRIEFTRDYWLVKIPYRPNIQESLYRFFESLDNIGIYVTQQRFDDPFSTTLVYNLKNNRGFFRGSEPASDQDIYDLSQQFPNNIFPQDYLNFLKIHNGFAKTTDCTGILSTAKILPVYNRIQEIFLEKDLPLGAADGLFDPAQLIPFYESFGMPYFQCFWGEWHPDQAMGNVYLSGDTGRISNVKFGDTMAFTSFTDWLMFYLEQIG